MKFRVPALAAACTALAFAGIFYAPSALRGSDHQDSPVAVSRPATDIADAYLFPSPTNPQAVDLVMNVYPLIPAGQAASASFDPGALYEFKFVHGAMGTTAPEDLVVQVRATGTGPSQTLTIYGPAKPALIGTQSVIDHNYVAGTIPFNNAGGTTLHDGIVAFAGPRADPFFIDLFQFFAILPDRNYANKRTNDKFGSATPSFNGFTPGSTSKPGGAGYACSTAPATNTQTQINGGFNVLTIVLEVPKALLVANKQSPVVHFWTTVGTATSIRINRETVYQQIQRFGRPWVKELWEFFSEHATSDAQSPYADLTLRRALRYFIEASHIAGRSIKISTVEQRMFYPDEIAADLSQPGPASYLGLETNGATGSTFGGRGLTDNIVDTTLGIVFGSTIPAVMGVPDDGKENACLTTQNVSSGQGGIQTQPFFPYLASPH